MNHRSGLARRWWMSVAAVAALVASASGVATASAIQVPAPAGPLDVGSGCLANSVVEGLDSRCRNELWAAVYDDTALAGTALAPIPERDEVRSMAVSPTGDTVFTLGTNSILRPTGWVVVEWSLVATDATTGEQRWVVRLPADGGNLSLHAGVAVSADGRRVYVAGTYSPVVERDGDGEANRNPLVHNVAITAAYSAATGEEMWVGRVPASTLVGHRDSEPGWFRDGDIRQDYDLHADASLAAMVVSPTDDSVYVTGARDGGDTFMDLYAVSYDGATGDIKWSSLHDTSTPASRYARDQARPNVAAVSPNGERLYVGGCQPCVTLFGYQGHDPGSSGDDGRQLFSWNAPLDPTWIEVAPNGSRVYLAGGGGMHAFDAATGERLWGGGRGVPEAPLVPVALSPRGDALFVIEQLPEAVGSGEGDYGLFGYDAATGKELWSARYDGIPSDTVEDPDGQRFRSDTTDTPSAVAVSPDGTRVYVTGTSQRIIDPGDTGTETSTDPLEGTQAIVAYDVATGEQLWSARYRHIGSGPEQGRLVDIGPDGTVFTAGNAGVNPVFSLRGNEQDWTIQAYAP